MTACYDEYKSDFDFTAAYFAFQHPARTVIVDPDAETFEIKVGVVYGGRYSYEGTSETVGFSIEDSLITNNDSYLDMGIKLMPSSWYTITDDAGNATSKFEIVNNNTGFVNVSINKAMMIAEADASQNTYAIPFVITESSTDSILAGKEFSALVVKFKNQFDGRYILKGEDVSFNIDGSVSETIVYNDPDMIRDYVFLNTIAKDKLTVPRVGSKDGVPYTLTFNEAGVSVLSPAEGSDVSELVGAATYDFNTKTFICNYQYKFNGVNHVVVDTLVYSNTELSLEEWY